MALSCFSLAFSASSTFSRRASDTSRPPYFIFYSSKVAPRIPRFPHSAEPGGPARCSLKYPDNLLFRKPGSLLLPFPAEEQTLTIGGISGEQVTGDAKPLPAPLRTRGPAAGRFALWLIVDLKFYRNANHQRGIRRSLGRPDTDTHIDRGAGREPISQAKVKSANIIIRSR